MTSECLFDAYVMVDWSANSTPKRGRDSIWYCYIKRFRHGLRRLALNNPATRADAFRALQQLLHNSSERILVGFDFPNAYPQGFARLAGFNAKARPWRQIWDGLDDLIQDHPDNANNRYVVASALNKRISADSFPFWGCPQRHANPYLSTHKLHDYHQLSERRLCERFLPRTQPCWKLAYTGSVGSQTLLGIPIKKALRDDKQLRAVTRVWPFETGLAPPKRKHRIILAEVYPSLITVKPKPSQVKDALQVDAIARHFAKRDELGLLAKDFAGPPELSQEQQLMIVQEEGWILGAGTAHLRNNT